MKEDYAKYLQTLCPSDLRTKFDKIGKFHQGHIVIELTNPTQTTGVIRKLHGIEIIGWDLIGMSLQQCLKHSRQQLLVKHGFKSNLINQIDSANFTDPG